MPVRNRTGVLVAAVTLLALAASAHAQARFDVLIRGGHIVDGSGNPWFKGDLGITAGRIVSVGDLAGASGARVIDATGRLVSPGFIDLHSHADDGSDRDGQGTLRDAADPRRRAAPNLVTQGITTVVVNQDGRSVWPIREQRATMERLGMGPNAMLLVGHGEVRRQAMGTDFQRAATAAEVQRMRELVREGMRDGAFGISAGLEYVPGRWSTTDEVVAIVEEIVPYRGVYISHERSEGADPMWYWPSQDPPGPPTLIDAVSETIEIGERTGAVVVASHIKAKGAHYWGTGAAAIQLIERARARGVQVYADQYPYDTSGSDGSTVLVPDWALAGAGAGGGARGGARGGGAGTDFAARLRTVLAQPARAAALRSDIAHEIRRRGGAEKVVIFDYPDTTYVGRSLAELATRRNLSPVEMAITLQLEGYRDRRGGARTRGFSLSELDIEMYAAKNWVATATDGGIALPEDGPGTHARFYGTFPRKIRRYALDRGVLTLEDAVRSATGLPAQILGLKDRGCLREGCAADIVVFDEKRIADRATFFQPHQYAEGIDFVLINGQLVVDNARVTGALPGKVITPESAGRRPTT
jgi:N-acyl-D-amino-acid deacylase